MVKKSATALFHEECKKSKREATVADMDRMTETQESYGLLFENFDAFEAWEAQRKALSSDSALPTAAASSSVALAQEPGSKHVPPPGGEPQRTDHATEAFNMNPSHSGPVTKNGLMLRGGSSISDILQASDASDWNSSKEPEIPPTGGSLPTLAPTIEEVVRIRRVYTPRVIGAKGRHFSRLQQKHQVQLTTIDNDLETAIVIRGIEANIRQAKAEIETIVRNADLNQFDGISVRQKSRSFDPDAIVLATPSVVSVLPPTHAAAFGRPTVPLQGFDAALLNAPGFQPKFAIALLSRVATKQPLPADMAEAAKSLTQFDSNTTVMDGLTALDHVELLILRAYHINNKAEVQDHVARQRTLAFQLFERLVDALYDLPGPSRVRYITGVDRKWNHIDIANLFQGKVLDVVRCRVGGADLSIDGRAYVIFDSSEDASLPANIQRIKKCELPQKREALCVQLVFRLRSLYAICAGMTLSDQGFRHSSMQPVRAARRTAAQLQFGPARQAHPEIASNFDHVEQPLSSAVSANLPEQLDIEGLEDISDDDADTDVFPQQVPTRSQNQNEHPTAVQAAATRSPQQTSNPFIKFNAKGTMMLPVTPLKWAAGKTPINFWIGEILKQHYAPGLWLKMSMMGKNWHDREQNGELDKRVVTKDGYISRGRMLQRLREIWDRFSPGDEAFRHQKRRRDRVVDLFEASLAKYRDHASVYQPSLFAPPARGCYAIPKDCYLVFVDTEEELQKFVRFAKKWTSNSCVAYDSEGSSSHPETIQFASGPWNKATSIVLDVPACKRFASFVDLVNTLRNTEARFFAQATRRESDTLGAISSRLRFKHLIDIRQVVYKCWLGGTFTATSLDPVEADKRKEAEEHPNLTSFHFLVNDEMLSKAETIGTHWVRPLSNASLRYCHADVLCMLKTLDKCYEKSHDAFNAIMTKGGHQNYEADRNAPQVEYCDSDDDVLP